MRGHAKRIPDTPISLHLIFTTASKTAQGKPAPAPAPAKGSARDMGSIVADMKTTVFASKCVVDCGAKAPCQVGRPARAS